MALAFFDVDGTLTRFDTFISYCLLSLLYRPQRLFGLKPILKACFNFWKGRARQEKLKEAFLVTFLGGAERKDIDRCNKIFLRLVIPWIIRKEMLEKLRRHQHDADRVYLVSASPDIYLEPLARRWKLDGVICTVLEWKDDYLTGRILGRNCQGDEKARRIQLLFSESELEGSFAYGNDDGDRQLLELVTFGMKV